MKKTLRAAARMAAHALTPVRSASVFALALFLLWAGAAIGQAAGDYRSNAATMNWSATASWERYDGANWIANPAQGYPGQNAGTGNVTIRNGHNVTLDVSPANNFTSLTITGVDATTRSTLTLSSNGATRTLPTLSTSLVNFGQILWTVSNITLALPAGAALTINTNGRVWPDGSDASQCTAAQRITIGGLIYASCGGNPGQFTFFELNQQGGTISAVLTTPAEVCNGGPFDVTVSYNGVPGTTTANGATTGVSYELRRNTVLIFSGILTPGTPSITHTINTTSAPPGLDVFALTVNTYIGANLFTNTATNNVVVVADPLAPTATKSPNVAAVCAGQNLTLTGVTDNGGGTGTCNFEYRFSTDGGVNWSAWSTTLPSFAAVAGAANAIEVRKVCNGAGCDASPANTYSWSVETQPTITVSPASQTVNQNATPTTLMTNTTGGAGNCTIQWQSSPDGMAPWNNEATGSTYVPPTGTLGTTYYRAVYSCDASACPAAESNVVTVTVAAVQPLVLSIDAPASVACGEEVDIPVVINSGFVDMASLQFSVSWSSTLFDYIDAVATSPGGALPGLNTQNTASGQLGYFWDSDDINGYTLNTPDFTTLTITLKGKTCATSAALDFGDSPLVREAFNVNFTQLNMVTNGATVDIVDLVDPVFQNCPVAPIDLGCNPQTGDLPTEALAIAAAGAVTDNCGLQGVAAVGGAITGGCVKTQVWTVTATDICGNSADCQVTYTWKVDTDAPVLANVPAGGDLGCNPTPPGCDANVTATDACDGIVNVTCTPGTVVETGCLRSQTFTYSATDQCGNTASQTVTYTWKVDVTAPVLAGVPAGGDLGCNPATLPACDNGVTATDACDGTVNVTCTPGTIVETGCLRSQTFTYSATDQCGNTASQTVTYTWKVDVTAPVLAGVPAGGDLGCNPATLPACDNGVTATDACDGTVNVTCTPGTIVETGCLRSQTFIYSATDQCGNTASQTVTYTWKVDVTAPVLAGVPAGGDLGCNPATLPACDNGVTATDACDGTVNVTCTPGTIVETGCLRSQTFTYSATDQCGNTASQTVTYTWKVDVTAPVLAGVPAGGDLGCNPATLPACDNGVTATDACDGTVNVTCTPGTIVETGCLRSQTFTYSATDQCGNTASQTVTYTWKVDVTAPVLAGVPAGGDLGCNPATLPACDNGVTATDACDGTVNVTCTPGTIVETGCLRSQTFTYSATDQCGNTASQTVTYTWKVDVTAPVLAGVPAGGDLGCNPATLPACDNGVTATDACDGTVNVTCTPGTIVETGCLRSQTFTYSATDQCGNTASQTVTYTWKVDVTAPVLAGVPAGGDLGCNPATLPACDNGVTATDACDGNVNVTCTPGTIVETGCQRSQTFTYSATDQCGNTASQTVTYTWKVDVTAPVLAGVPAGGDLGCNPATLPACDNGVTATDACDGNVNVTCTPGTIVETGCLRSQTFTYSATDQCGNTASQTVTYTWKVDVTAPVLAGVPAGGDLGCNPATLPACDNGVTATDACDGNVNVTCTPGTIVETGCLRSQAFTYSATDQCGNTASQTVTYTWKVDVTAPVLAGVPAGGDLGCNPATLPACDNGVTATDACDGTVNVTCTPGTIVETGCLRSQAFTYSATDQCGNTASQTVTYTWKVDVTAPVLAGVPAGGDLGSCPAPATLPACDNGVTATDACDGTVNVTCTPGTIVETGCLRSQTFTYSATDQCGNTASQTVTYTWKVDVTAPVLAGVPAGGDLGCNPATLPACDNGVTATDACDGTVNVTCTPGTVVETGCLRSQTFTYSATDQCGNTASQTVTYTWKVDVTAPVLAGVPAGGDLGSCPAPATLPACDNGVTATDACDGDVDVTCTPGQIEEDGCERSQTFTYAATDQCGNTASATVTYTWKVDTAPPVLTNLPDGDDLGCNPATLPACDNGVTATDACDGDVDVTCTPGQIEEDGCERSQTFTYAATDECGNTASATVTYTWKVDTAPPVLANLPDGDDLGCNPENLPVCSTAVTATDNCDGDVDVTCTPGQIEEDGCERSQTFTYAATDECGNTASATVTYTWTEDETGPDITCPTPDESYNTDPGACSAELSFTATAEDECPGQVAIAYFIGDDEITFPYQFPLGTTTVRVEATDACDNTSDCTFTVVVEDKEPPTALCQSIVVDLDADGTVTITGAQLDNGSFDNCGGDLTFSVSPSTFTCEDVGVNPVTLTVTDANGNSSTCTTTAGVPGDFRIFGDNFVPADPTGYDGQPIELGVRFRSSVNGSITKIHLYRDPTANPPAGNETLTANLYTNTGTLLGTGTLSVDNVSIGWVAINLNVPVNITAATTYVAAVHVPSGNYPFNLSQFLNSGVVNAPLEALQNGVDGLNGVYKYGASGFPTESFNASGYSVDVTLVQAGPPLTVTVNDVTPPTALCQDITVSLGEDGTVTITANQIDNGSNDACGIESLSVTPANFTCDNLGDNTVTLTVTDVNNNTNTCTATVTVEDDLAPVAPAAPAPAAYACEEEVPAPGPLTATDNCDGDITATGVDTDNDGAGCANDPLIITRTWTFTDASGNSSSVSQTITVIDDVAPVAPAAPAPATYACAEEVPAPGALTATDNCSGEITVTGTDSNNEGAGCANDPLIITRTWTFTDDCGNSSSVSQTITVIDDVAPTAPAAPAAASYTCETDVPAAGALTATDNCSPDITVTGVDTDNGGAGCANDPLIITRTWTFTDDCGNSSTVSQTITVIDDVAPVAQAPAPATYACAGNVPAPGPLTAIDNCSGEITVTGTDSNNEGTGCANDPLIITRTWTFTDDCGNSSTVSQTITVIDDVAPTAPAAPASASYACAGDVPAPGALTATDNCSGEITVTGTDSNNEGAGCANDPLIITRTWTFTDDCGNSSSVSQTITVIDDVAPTAPAAPAAASYTCETDVPAPGQLTATDNCSPDITVTGVDTDNEGAGCANDPLIITRTWTFTDACGNSSSVSQTITVIDNVAPTAPAAPAAASYTCETDVPAPGQLTATDNCSPDITVTGVDTDNGGAGCANDPLVITRTWTFTDACGNSSSVSQTITVIDNVAPTAPAAPAAASYTCETDVPAPGQLTATDNCSPDITVTGVDTDNGGAGCANDPLVITRTWTFTDACGNSSSVSQTITVIDDVAPTAPAAPAAASYTCATAVPAAGALTATDNCSPDITVTGVDTDNDGAGCANDPLIITRTWTFTDACGNSSTVSQTITVVDDVAPEINCPATAQVFSNTPGFCYATLSFSNITAQDNCDDDVDLAFFIGDTPISLPYNFPVGTTTVTIVATDDCGNTDECTFDVVVNDNENPTITCPAPQILLLGDNCSAPLPDYTGNAIVNDNCQVASVTQSPAPGTIVTNPGVTQVTLTVMDVNGNSNSCTFNVNAADIEQPTAICMNQTITFNGETSIPLNASNLVDADDNCGLESITLTPSSINCIQLGQQVPVTVRVRDLSGNISECTSTVTVAGLPCGWKFIPNSVGCGGSVNYNPPTGVWTATAQNCFYGPSYTADALIFAQRTLCGDGSITARVTNISGTSLGWAGVVMRETTAVGSKKAQLMTNLSNLSRREFRTVTNGSSQPQQFPSQNRYWLRLVRAGNQFTGFVSPDGQVWFLVMAQLIPMNQCIEIGLVVTNYQQISTVTATFDNVAHTGNNTPLMSPQDNPNQLREMPGAPEFNVFPNPTEGELSIDISQYIGRAARIEVYNMQGQLLKFAEIDEVQNAVEQLDLSGHPAGAYMIRLKSAGVPDATRRVMLSKVNRP